jgi:GT2 family glycosyltransferase
MISNRVSVRHNDYRTLTPAPLGRWRPRQPVSVVVPAHGDQDRLDLTLAGLAGQTYPEHLLEVVVVDDGSTPPLHLPELRPARTLLVRADTGRWGPAHAVHTGVAAAAAPTILRLDSDMITYRRHVEAHLRWHHLADYLVVLGEVWFSGASPGDLDPASVRQAVESGAAAGLFPAEQAQPSWTARVIAETDGLTAPGSHPFRVASGATISWSRRLYQAAGGMDHRLLLGSDTEFGYRLAQAGAVFVPEPKARAWHLGRSQMQARRREGKRYRAVHLSHRIPTYRSWRSSGRQWQVPYVDVVVDADQASYEDVHATVSGALAGTLPDVGVTIAGPWSGLTEHRRSVLDDPLLDLRLIRAAFEHDGRAVFTERVPATSAPAPFRLRLPAGLVPTPDGLQGLTRLAEQHSYGLVQLAFPTPDGLAVARLERTAAVARALAVTGGEPTEARHLDDLVDEMYGSYWLDGSEWALTASGEPGR